MMHVVQKKMIRWPERRRRSLSDIRARNAYYRNRLHRI